MRWFTLITAATLVCASCSTLNDPIKQRQRQIMVECLDQNGWQKSFSMRGQPMVLNPASLNVHRHCRSLARIGSVRKWPAR